MKKTLSIVATTILLGSTAVAPMAFAQNATTAKPAASDTMKSDTTTAPKAPMAAETKTPMATDTMASQEVYLTQQGTDQVAASNYIDQDVYTAGDKSIGKINDLIMQKDGTVVAAVIGVGGFLGMGEKNVAVPISKITVTHDAKDPATLHLTTTETADSLKTAPAFKTLSEQKS
ncbi:photosystem reaction center subunit H [Rhizobium oryziradicis]|uniref:Photosystem reaction center subunit H n=2 Tax=Rhizobium oryziradicis TaxID=1867956 RepID=A0A1Q8ZV93_9HYPH|nr:photosystem reaction center subunit H [Rhizobium oryziradicis]